MTSMCIPVDASKPLHFSGQTLILPTTSIGSVPQLCLDLLIHAPSLQCKRVAYLDATECVPFVAPSEVGAANDIYSALDVFQASGGITIVQQRSPVIKAFRASFVQRLMQWIESAEFSEILILSSMDAAMRVDHEFATPFVYARPMQATEGPVASAITSQYPPFQPSLQGSNVVSMPGSGLARMYLEHAPPNTTALFLFCAEGDNRSDAHAMAKRVTALLHKETDSFPEPPSWNSLFGDATASMMFG